MRLVKSTWYVKAKASYVHDNTRGGKAKLGLSKLTSVFHHLPRVGPKQLSALLSSTTDYKIYTSEVYQSFGNPLIQIPNGAPD